MVTITAGTVTMIVTRPAGSEAVASVPPAARRRRMSESRVKAAGSRAGTAAPPPAPARRGPAQRPRRRAQVVTSLSPTALSSVIIMMVTDSDAQAPSQPDSELPARLPGSESVSVTVGAEPASESLAPCRCRTQALPWAVPVPMDASTAQ